MGGQATPYSFHIVAPAPRPPTADLSIRSLDTSLPHTLFLEWLCGRFLTEVRRWHASLVQYEGRPAVAAGLPALDGEPVPHQCSGPSLDPNPGGGVRRLHPGSR